MKMIKIIEYLMFLQKVLHKKIVRLRIESRDRLIIQISLLCESLGQDFQKNLQTLIIDKITPLMVTPRPQSNKFQLPLSKLLKLHLQGTMISRKGIKSIIIHNRSIRQLNLFDEYFFDDECAIKLSKRAQPFSKIRLLKCNLSPRGIKPFFCLSHKVDTIEIQLIKNEGGYVRDLIKTLKYYVLKKPPICLILFTHRHIRFLLFKV